MAGFLRNMCLFNFKEKYSLLKETLFTQFFVMLVFGFVLLIPNNLIAYTGMLLFWFLYALINTIFLILYFGNIQLKVPREIIGSLFGTILTIFSLVNPLSAVASGFLVLIFEISLLIILLSLLMLISAWAIRFLSNIETVFE